MLLIIFMQSMNQEWEKICDIGLSESGLICLTSRNIHLLSSNTILYLWLEENFHMYINYTFLIHLSAVGYLRWFHVTAFVKRVAMDINEWVTPWCIDLLEFSKNPGSGIAGSCDKSYVQFVVWWFVCLSVCGGCILFCFWDISTYISRAVERKKPKGTVD